MRRIYPYFLVLLLLLTACVVGEHEETDRLLKIPAVEEYMRKKSIALQKQYNDSKMWKFKVSNVVLEVETRQRSQEGRVVTLLLTQRVEDEFGKELPVFEGRKFKVVFERKNDTWLLSEEKLLGKALVVPKEIKPKKTVPQVKPEVAKAPDKQQPPIVTKKTSEPTSTSVITPLIQPAARARQGKIAKPVTVMPEVKKTSKEVLVKSVSKSSRKPLPKKKSKPVESPKVVKPKAEVKKASALKPVTPQKSKGAKKLYHTFLTF